MQLITRELWHGLNHALPRHPLLWYPLRHQDVAPDAPSFWIEFVPTMMLMVAALVSIILWAIYGLSPLTLILVLDTYAGVVITRGVTMAMQRARERGLLDLMGVTPSGQMGATWALMTRYLRRDPTLSGLHQAASWLHATWLFGLLPFGGLVLLTLCGNTAFATTEFSQLFNHPLTLFNGAVVFGVMMLDYLSAMVCGALCGMILASVRNIYAESVYIAPLGFIGVQACCYAALFLLHVLLNALLNVSHVLNGWTSTVSFLVAFVLLREASVWLLCRILAWQMNTSVGEVLKIHRRSL